MAYRYWTEEETQFLRQHYGNDMYARQIAEQFGRTQRSVEKKAEKLGLSSELRAPVWNAGKTYHIGDSHHNFRPALQPYENAGRMYIKLTKHGKPKAYNRYVWEQHKGAIPKGHLIVHNDGNNLNCNIDNLSCVSRAQLVRRNYDKADKSLMRARMRMTRCGESFLDQILMQRI